jgi:hypothetical protein
MFHAADPRAALAPKPKTGASQPVSRFSAAEYARFYDQPPQEQGPSWRTWYARGQNFVVAYTELSGGERLERRDQQDEYCVLLPDIGTAASIETAAGTEAVPGASIVFVPPGDSAVAVASAGRVIRIFSAQSADLNAMCSNASSFVQPQPNIPPYRPWPAPRGGWRVRRYSLDVQGDGGRFGRIFRCSTLMVNILDPRLGLRDITKLSPHHHDDFEQGSLVIDGGYVHDIRWPWVPDMTVWREDEHEFLAAPSLTVIPPPAVHTSRSVLPGLNQMIDIFAPPRRDFSEKAGWVLNADDYPMPGEAD